MAQPAGTAPTFQVSYLFILATKELNLTWLRQFSALNLDWPQHEDHAESLVQQLADAEAQKRENKYYPLWSSAAAFLCSIHSGTLRLENAPVAELFFATELTPEEMARMKDADWDVDDLATGLGDEHNTVSATPEPDDLPPGELRGLRDNRRQLDGHAWIPMTTKEERRVLKSNVKNKLASAAARGAIPAPAPALANRQLDRAERTPDGRTSISAATTAMGPTTVRIPRATDILFLARAQVEVFNKCTGSLDEEQQVPAIPALALELKVPKRAELQKNSDAEEVDPGFQRGPDREESIRGRKSLYYIRYTKAIKAIADSHPQIVQQAQLIFHGWTKLDTTWVVGASGRWVRFFKFKRGSTPTVAAEDLHNGIYFTGALGGIFAHDSGLFCFIDDSGKYTRTFRKYWNTVMRDVEVQYEKCILGGRLGRQ
ncbi:hypothetical protein BD779DRAFT_1479372 [Infundibulicybe gibba]|nr:hypothetical protein BD779DRAFT_1479372 [Infundibulicybe gibba]